MAEQSSSPNHSFNHDDSVHEENVNPSNPTSTLERGQSEELPPQLGSILQSLQSMMEKMERTNRDRDEILKQDRLLTYSLHQKIEDLAEKVSFLEMERAERSVRPKEPLPTFRVSLPTQEPTATTSSVPTLTSNILPPPSKFSHPPVDTFKDEVLPSASSQYKTSPSGIKGENSFQDIVLQRLVAQETQTVMISESLALLTQIVGKPKNSKAVPPAKYNPDKDQDLYVFFKEFEEYCTILYPSQKPDWLRLLGSYLLSSYLDLYHQLKENGGDYESVKAELFEWYRHDLIIKNERAVADYLSAQLLPKETVPIFAIRLLKLAKKAYPAIQEHDLRQHDQHRRIFLSALPTAIQREITSFLKNNEWFSGTKVNFEQIINLADHHMRDQRTTKQTAPEVVQIDKVEAEQNQSSWADTVKKWMHNNDSTPARSSHSNNVNSKNRGQNRQQRYTRDNNRQQYNSNPSDRRNSSQNQASAGPNNSNQRANNNANRSPQRPDTSNSDQWCSFCTKNTHNLDVCYIFNRICSYCRQQGHVFYTCPTRPPNRSITPQTNLCPVCNQRGHAGRNCPQWQDERPPSTQRGPRRNSSSRSPGRGQRNPSNNTSSTVNEVSTSPSSNQPTNLN